MNLCLRPLAPKAGRDMQQPNRTRAEYGKVRVYAPFQEGLMSRLYDRVFGGRKIRKKKTTITRSLVTNYSSRLRALHEG